MCACIASWTKHVAPRPNWCVFQEGRGGPVGCQETKFECRSCYTVLCVSLSLSLSLCVLASCHISICIDRIPFWGLIDCFLLNILLILILLQHQTFKLSVAGVVAPWLSGCSSWYWTSSAPHCCFLQRCPLCIHNQVWVHLHLYHIFFLIVWPTQCISVCLHTLGISLFNFSLSLITSLLL